MAYLTLTGIDEGVSAQWINEMERKFITPSGSCGIEFAFLRSPKVGQSPPYPTNDTIRKITGHVYPTNLAFHLCGRYAQMVHDGEWNELCDIIDFNLVKRVQVNSKLEDEKAMMTLLRFAAHIERPVVMQWRGPIFPYVSNLNLLQDRSGGTGQLPEAWAKPTDLVLKPYSHHRMGVTSIGYAGGLNPDNIAEQLPLIRKAARSSSFWIDCETGIRTDDMFDVVKAEAMATAVFNFFKWDIKS